MYLRNGNLLQNIFATVNLVIFLCVAPHDLFTMSRFERGFVKFILWNFSQFFMKKFALNSITTNNSLKVITRTSLHWIKFQLCLHCCEMSIKMIARMKLIQNVLFANFDVIWKCLKQFCAWFLSVKFPSKSINLTQPIYQEIYPTLNAIHFLSVWCHNSSHQYFQQNSFIIQYFNEILKSSRESARFCMEMENAESFNKLPR